jgi:hypothetical protein
MLQKNFLRVSFTLLLLSASLMGNAQTTNYKTYSVFLYSFTKYIEWPNEARNGEFVIAVLGNQKLLQEMQTAVAGRKAGAQTIKIVESKSVDDLDQVHMVFISDMKSGSTDDVVTRLKGKPVLVVTERDGLVKKGAGVSFVIAEDNTLKFQVNEQALNDHRLKASSAILSLAVKAI